MRLIREQLKSAREHVAESAPTRRETRELCRATTDLIDICETLLAKADKQQTRIRRLQREIDALR